MRAAFIFLLLLVAFSACTSGQEWYNGDGTQNDEWNKKDNDRGLNNWTDNDSNKGNDVKDLNNDDKKLDNDNKNKGVVDGTNIWDKNSNNDGKDIDNDTGNDKVNDKENDKGKNNDKGEKNNNDNKNEEKNLYYPCRTYRYEEECVSRLLESTGQCKRVHKYDQKKIVYAKEAIQYVPNSNLTLLKTDVKITGLDGKIDQFYVNKSSGNLVYGVIFDKITITSDKAYLYSHRRGKEPVVTYGFIRVTYSSVYLTAVIPLEHGISLKDARVTAFVGSPLPIIELGPGLADSSDPTAQQSVLSAISNARVTQQEVFLTEAPLFFNAYLQNYICDFGIKL